MKIAVSNLTGAERAALLIFAWAGGTFKDRSRPHAAVYRCFTNLYGQPHGVVAGERFSIGTFDKLLQKGLIRTYGEAAAPGRYWCEITPEGAALARQLNARKR